MHELSREEGFRRFMAANGIAVDEGGTSSSSEEEDEEDLAEWIKWSKANFKLEQKLKKSYQPCRRWIRGC